MSIKFPRADNNAVLVTPGGASLTLPDADWSLSFSMVLDGATAGNIEQYVLSHGFVFQLVYTGSGHATPNRLLFTTPLGGFGTAGPFASGKWMFVIQRTGSSLTVNACPTLQAEPANGSAVATTVIRSVGQAFSGDGPFAIGAPSNYNQPAASGLFCDQSIARVGLLYSSLTTLEIAQLAYGKTLAQLGKVPEMYVRMNDVNDITDTGADANVFTKAGALTTGTDPGFGFGAVITAPVFTSPPAISGMPRVGTARTYTPGTITTNEAPTVTVQWTISSTIGGTQTDIAGATGPAGTTYTPVAGDVGKYLRVREKASNSAAPLPTGVTSSSDPVQVLAAVGATTRTMAFVMRTGPLGDTLVANRTGLRVGVFTGDGPDDLGTTLYQFNGKTTDANGNFSISFDNPAIAAGQQVLIMIFGANGDHYIAKRAVA